MAIQFPTSIDDLANVSVGDTIAIVHKNDLNDYCEALATKIGADSSAVATSHDYMLRNLPAQDTSWDAGGVEVRALTLQADVVTGTAPLTITSTTVVANLNADKVDGKDAPTGDIVGTTDAQTLTNKTLTSPTIGTSIALPANAVDAITEIATALKSGADGTLITGTKGTTNYIAKWNADGDLVDGYALIDDDSMATASATNVASAESTKAYIDAKAFGSWVDKSSSYASQQATTDGFIVCRLTGNSQTAIGYTDSDTNPSTIRCAMKNGTEAGETFKSFTMPVKKNDYWKVTVSGAPTIYWIPLS